jgi:hypothetical protein
VTLPGTDKGAVRENYQYPHLSRNGKLTAPSSPKPIFSTQPADRPFGRLRLLSAQNSLSLAAQNENLTHHTHTPGLGAVHSNPWRYCHGRPHRSLLDPAVSGLLKAKDSPKAALRLTENAGRSTNSMVGFPFRTQGQSYDWAVPSRCHHIFLSCCSNSTV